MREQPARNVETPGVLEIVEQARQLREYRQILAGRAAERAELPTL